MRDVLRNRYGLPLGWFYPPSLPAQRTERALGEIVPPNHENAPESKLGAKLSRLEATTEFWKQYIQLNDDCVSDEARTIVNSVTEALES